MKPSDEIANLSDDAILMLCKMFNEQYKCGFEYATYCWGGNMKLPEVKETLSRVQLVHTPDYLRSLIRARK